MQIVLSGLSMLAQLSLSLAQLSLSLLCFILEVLSLDLIEGQNVSLNIL